MIDSIWYDLVWFPTLPLFGSIVRDTAIQVRPQFAIAHPPTVAVRFAHKCPQKANQWRRESELYVDKWLWFNKNGSTCCILYTIDVVGKHKWIYYYSDKLVIVTYGPRKAVAEVSNHNEPIGRKSGIQLVRKIRKSMDFTFSCLVLNWLTD